MYTPPQTRILTHFDGRRFIPAPQGANKLTTISQEQRVQTETRFLAATAGLGLSLSSNALEPFRRYQQALEQWNQRANLTAITGYEEVFSLHFLDSLSTLLALPNGSNTIRLLDVGAGAGFPGLPLKLAKPDLQLTLLEATAKKTAFLDALVTELGLESVTVLTGRAEAAAHVAAHREQYGAVVSRGVAKLATLAEYLLPFCKVGGLAIAMKQGDIAGELTEAERAIGLLGGVLQETVAVDLPGLPPGRQLVVMRKAHATPPAYPRRTGLPAKRPL